MTKAGKKKRIMQNDMTLKNKDIIWLLENVMEVCSQLMAAKKNFESKECGFVDPFTQKVCSLTAGAAGALFRCVYDGYCNSQDDSGQVHIQGLLYDGNEWKEHQIVFQSHITGMSMESARECDTEALEKIRDSLGETFLPEEKYLKFQDSLGKFIDARKQIDFSSTIFPDESEIKNYLQKYYEILGAFLLNKDYINSEKKISDLMDTLLYLDTPLMSLRETEKAALGSIYHPIALNALLKTYWLVEGYWSKLEENSNTVMDAFYKEVVIKKAQFAFRWFMVDPRRNLFHAAVSPYVKNELHNGKIGVWIRNIDQYNSFEGIGEMRLAEKILYEYGRWGGRKKTGEVFHVAVLGDISMEPMEQLAEYLCNSIQRFYLQESGNNVQLDFDIYTKNGLKESVMNENTESTDRKITINDICVKICFDNQLDELLTNRSKIDSLIENHELIFMLDCCKLYQTMESQAQLSDAVVQQQFVAKKFDEVSLRDRIDICKKNLLDKLYENLSVYKKNGYWGSFQKTANDLLLRYCENKVKSLHPAQTEKTRYCTLYVYVSDRNAFNSIFCNDKYYMRTERYNQKRIGIIRFTSVNTEKTCLPVGLETGDKCQGQGEGTVSGSKKMLCFNLWQIVKHIDLENRNQIICLISKELTKDNKKKSDIPVHDFDLQRMFIGIDYSAWPDRLEVYHAIDGDDSAGNEYFERFMDCFVEKVALPVLESSWDDLFGQYFWRALCSLLYSDAKNMQDMLLLHFLTDRYDMVGSFCIGENTEERRKDVIQNINRDYKYSIKRFVEMIMREYDTTAIASYSQMQTEYMIRQNHDIEGGMVKMFKGVKEACEQMSYKNSYLYENCKKILQEETL